MISASVAVPRLLAFKCSACFRKSSMSSSRSGSVGTGFIVISSVTHHTEWLSSAKLCHHPFAQCYLAGASSPYGRCCKGAFVASGTVITARTGNLEACSASAHFKVHRLGCRVDVRVVVFVHARCESLRMHRVFRSQAVPHFERITRRNRVEI